MSSDVIGVGGNSGILNTACLRDENLRPEYILENHEDMIYHEPRLPSVATEPEFCGFLDKNLVFNRAMSWLDAPNDTLICLCESGDLSLTGDEAVSKWFSDPVNKVEDVSGGTTRFTKRSNRRRDCLVLPALQFGIEQHPVVELSVSKATTDWQFCIIVKGRSGPPLVASPWQSGAGRYCVNIDDALKEHGYELHYAELSFVLGAWNESTEREETVEFSLQLKAAAAIVPCLPVIRTLDSVADGVPVSTVVLDANGRRMLADTVSVNAILPETANSWQLTEQDGIWSGLLTGLATGDHSVDIICEGDLEEKTKLSVRITDVGFINYDKSRNMLKRKDQPLGPLSGSYQGMVYASDIGTPDESIINGEEAFVAWDCSRPQERHFHYWEALTEKELDTRFQYLGKCGWNLLHLCQHWGLWEKLDAGGHIAPHGAEQVALYYRIAAKYGMSTVQALSHYPYDSGHTPPYQQYIENGFKDGDWQNVGSAFTQMFHGYLKEYTQLFGNETAIAYLTTSGEGDIAAGPDRINDTCAFMKKHAPNLLFLSEPVHRLQSLPDIYFKGWNAPEWIMDAIPTDAVNRQQQTAWQQPLFGSRLYWIGNDFEPELDLDIEFKLMQMASVFMGEGSWPNPHCYSKLMNHKRTWCATPEYRLRVRDTMCIGLIHRNPVMLTWDEQLAEDEHKIVDIVRRQVDWSQKFMHAPLAIRVNDDNVSANRSILKQYEEHFSAIPIATRYITENTPVPENAGTVLDARKNFNIPDNLQSLTPLLITSNSANNTKSSIINHQSKIPYRASYCWSEDRHTLLAYFYNCTGHEEIDYTASLGGNFHRKPQPTELSIMLQNFPDSSHTAKIYNLDEMECPQEINFSEKQNIDLGVTKSDFFILVTNKKII